MSYSEFCQWRAYFSVEQANYNQTDINIAILCSMFHNSNSKNGGSEPSDFLPYLKKTETAPQTEEDFELKAQAWANAIKRVSK
jgi:hypothetical protein